MKTKNLTIQEAIQSGFPFKRPEWIEYYEPDCNYNYSTKSLLATDWEIKVPEVTITREKLAEAWQKVRYAEKAELSITFMEICKELGL